MSTLAKHNQPGEFEWRAYFLAPPARHPCGCDPGLCAICPHRPATLLSAVWHDRGSQHWSARLGMSKMDLDDPFVSPDLRLLQTKICTTDSGVMTTELQGRDLRRHHAGPEHESLEKPRLHSLGMIQHDILISEQHEKLVLMRHGDPFRKTGRIP
jgi:hypothetical protein